MKFRQPFVSHWLFQFPSLLLAGPHAAFLPQQRASSPSGIELAKQCTQQVSDRLWNNGGISGFAIRQTKADNGASGF